MTNEERVRDFMEKAKQPIPERPILQDESVETLRLNLIEEELDELRVSIGAEDMVAIADAIADLLYVTYGMAVAYGIPIQKVFEEVHRSNMSKFIDGFEDPRSGKWCKGPSWSPPDIEPILKHGPEPVP